MPFVFDEMVKKFIVIYLILPVSGDVLIPSCSFTRLNRSVAFSFQSSVI